MPVVIKFEITSILFYSMNTLSALKATKTNYVNIN